MGASNTELGKLWLAMVSTLSKKTSIIRAAYDTRLPCLMVALKTRFFYEKPAINPLNGVMTVLLLFAVA